MRKTFALLTSLALAVTITVAAPVTAEARPGCYLGNSFPWCSH